MKIFVCFAMAAAALSAVPASAQIGSTEQAAILKAHNDERVTTGTGTAGGVLGALTWSTELAAYAQAWATSLATRDQGLLHRNSSPNAADQTPNNTLTCCAGQYLGENIYGNTAADDGTLGASAVASWISEKANYNYAADDGNGDVGNAPGCTAPQGSACGHYTQVVWRDTTQVGCGKATAKSGWTFVVCNYNSAGNYSGQKPF